MPTATPSGPKYRQPIRISNQAKSLPIDTRRRTAGKPYLPPINTSVPPTHRTIYLVYGNTGDYLGWIEEDAGNKWMFTMYYATDNKYKIRTQKSPRWSSLRTDPRKEIYEVATNATALVFVEKMLDPIDLVDTSNLKEMIEATKKAVMDQNDIANYNPDDPFGLLKDALPKARDIFHKEKEPFDKAALEAKKRFDREIADIRKAVLEGPTANLRKRLLDRLDDLAGAEAEKAKGSEEAGGNLDF